MGGDTVVAIGFFLDGVGSGGRWWVTVGSGMV